VRRESIFVDLLNIVVLWASLPEFPFGGTSSVSIVWGGAESTLFATMSDKAVFAGDREKEEDDSNYSNGETSSVEATCCVQRRQSGESIGPIGDSVID
jgi:hypothetical protein